MNDIMALIFIFSVLIVAGLSLATENNPDTPELKQWLHYIIKYQQAILLLTCFFQITESAGYVLPW